MNIPRTVHRLQWFMEATEREVCDKFLALPRAIGLEYRKRNVPIVFIPGTRKDRVLLVAHYDTIPGDGVKTMVRGTIIESAYNNIGIGADDRAGCAMLWQMRTLGHSLLLVPDEEWGGLGTSDVIDRYLEIIGDHQFMIEFDRRGDRDLVYYGFDTDEFSEFMEEAYYGYELDYGSYTDIADLIPAMGICGVNVSVGYMNEHCNDEFIDVCSFIRTSVLTNNLLTRKSLPRFEAPEGSYQCWGGYSSDYSSGYHLQILSDIENESAPFRPGGSDDDEEYSHLRKKVKDGFIVFDPCLDSVMCPHCLAVLDSDSYWIYDHDAGLTLCMSCELEFNVNEADLIYNYEMERPIYASSS